MRILHLPVCLILAFAASLRGVEVPAVPAIPDDQAFAVLVIPDLKAALGRIDQAMAAAKLPVPPGVVAGVLGGALGDPTLAVLGAGPILIAAAPGAPMPEWCAILPLADGAPLQALAGNAGFAAGPVPGGFAIASPVGGLDLAKRLAPGLPALAKAVPAGTDLRLLVAGDRITRTYLPMAMGLVQMGMQQGGGGPELARNIKAMQTALQLIAGQAGPSCLDLSSSAQGWRLDLLAAPAAGPLATGLTPPPAGADLANRLGLAAQPPVLTMAGRFPPQLYAAAARLIEQARKDPLIAQSLDAGLVAMLDSCAKAIDGRLAMRQGVPGNPFQQQAVMGVTDAVAVRQAFATGFAMLEKGLFADLMATSGLRMKLERAVRTSGTVEVDRMSYEVLPEAMPPGQAKMMQSMLKPLEVAVAKDLLVMGGPPAAVDALLSGANGKAMVAVAPALAGQWDLRAEWDLPMQMKYQFEMMRAQMPMIPPMFQEVKGGVPVLVGVAFGPGRVRLLAEVPATMVGLIAAEFAKQQRHRQDDIPAPNSPPATF